jgi:bacterioferritin-associated ferredoxin
MRQYIRVKKSGLLFRLVLSELRKLLWGTRMIVCQCMNISDRDIHAAIDWMRAADPETIVTPGKVYRALGRSADCGGCMPLFLATMRRNPNTEVPMTLRGLRRAATEEEAHEGRREGHRLSQPGTP